MHDHRASQLSNLRKAQGGFTLIELMVTAAIIAIIGAIALPSYQNFVTKTVRSQAKSQLTQVANRQEQFFLDNKTYATTMTDLGYDANPFYVNKEGFEVTSGSGDKVYKIAFNASSATSYTIEAVPQQHQETNDSECGTLRLTHTGNRTQSGSSDNCW